MNGVLKYLAITTLVVGLAAPWATAKGTPGDPQKGAYLGVMVDQVPSAAASAMHLSGGALIGTVDQDGPACHAGLKPGDIVTTFDGKAVTGPDQFASLIHSTAAGSTVNMTVLRDGKSQNMSVKLGNWSRMSAMVPPPPVPGVPMSPVGTMAPVLAMPAMPDVDIRTYTPMVARSGVVVEPLSSQLAEFFGVPANQGVLVRTVEKGGPGSSAGLRAGDVILKANNETIHDMADWKRALKAQSGKISLQVVRDKKSQTLQMVVPANTSELQGPDWEQFQHDMQAWAEGMKARQPEFEKNAREWAQMAKLDQKQLDDIKRQAEEAARSWTPEMQKQAEEMRKQAEQMSKDMAKMAPEWQKQAKEFAESWKPTAEQWKAMQVEIDKQMKEMQPELQKQMEEFQKDWQMRGPEFQKQMEQFEKLMQEWQKSWQENSSKRM